MGSDQATVNRIKQLKAIQLRPEFKTSTRDFLLSSIAPQQEAQTKVSFIDYSLFFTRMFKQQLFEPVVVMLLVLAFSLGSSLAVNAAFYSLPGEPLYRVKIALEKTQLQLTANESRQAELEIEFAHKRLSEFNKIVARTDVSSAEKKEQIDQVVREFQKNVGAVQQRITKIGTADQNINATEKQKTLQIALTISSKTDELFKTFDQSSSTLDASEKVAVESLIAEAVETAQQVNLSAQELLDESAATTTDEIITEQGTVEGEAFEEPGVADLIATSTIETFTETQAGSSQDVETTDSIVSED